MSRPADPLFKSDAEIAARLGVKLATWEAHARILEIEAPAIKKDPLYENKRYWPCVRAALDDYAGLTTASPPLAKDGEEHWEEEDHAEQRTRPSAKAPERGRDLVLGSGARR